MDITQVPCLQDNYAYLVTCPASGKSAVIDPADGPKLAQEIKTRGLTPVAILNTHHHWDHSGGNEYLCDRFPALRVYGSRYDAERHRIPRQSDALAEGDVVAIGKLSFSVIDIPGHTLGHIAYVGHGALFCGDTLFAAGCGRLFEGNPEMMLRSLSKLRALPEETLVYCGHEYTQKNLEFALSLEPDNPSVQRALTEVREKRAKTMATVPSRLGDEKRYNPFLRWDDPALQRIVGKTDPVGVFAVVRQLKDQF